MQEPGRGLPAWCWLKTSPAPAQEALLAWVPNQRLCFRPVQATSGGSGNFSDQKHGNDHQQTLSRRLGGKNYKSEVGEIFVHFKTVELLLVRLQLQGDDGTVPDRTGPVCPVLISLGLEWHWQLTPWLSLCPTAIIINKGRESVFKECLVVFYVQKVT